MAKFIWVGKRAGSGSLVPLAKPGSTTGEGVAGSALVGALGAGEVEVDTVGFWAINGIGAGMDGAIKRAAVSRQNPREDHPTTRTSTTIIPIHQEECFIPFKGSGK